jgi:hypothetical protein
MPDATQSEAKQPYTIATCESVFAASDFLKKAHASI